MQIGAMCAHTCVCTRAYTCVTGKRKERDFAELAAQLSTVCMYLLARYSRHYLEPQIPCSSLLRRENDFRERKPFTRFGPCSWQAGCLTSGRSARSPGSQQTSSGRSLFPQGIWVPTGGLPLGTDCLVPTLVQPQLLLLALVKVGLPQDTKTCAHASSPEGRWQRRSLSPSFPITARFPRGRNCGYRPVTTRIEFQPLGCLCGLRPGGN